MCFLEDNILREWDRFDSNYTQICVCINKYLWNTIFLAKWKTIINQSAHLIEVRFELVIYGGFFAKMKDLREISY